MSAKLNKQKARLKKIGLIIDDFDILIGSSTIYHDMIMVTSNTAHFSLLQNIILEDWTTAQKIKYYTKLAIKYRMNYPFPVGGSTE